MHLSANLSGVLICLDQLQNTQNGRRNDTEILVELGMEPITEAGAGPINWEYPGVEAGPCVLELDRYLLRYVHVGTLTGAAMDSRARRDANGDCAHDPSRKLSITSWIDDRFRLNKIRSVFGWLWLKHIVRV